MSSAEVLTEAPPQWGQIAAAGVVFGASAGAIGASWHDFRRCRITRLPIADVGGWARFGAGTAPFMAANGLVMAVLVVGAANL